MAAGAMAAAARISPAWAAAQEPSNIRNFHPEMRYRPHGLTGVAVSALEMAQNSIRYNWTRAEVDDKLCRIMGSIYDASAAAAAEYGLGDDLIAGNDIAAFKKISEAMIAQGL